MDFSEAVAAQLDGQTIRVARMVEFQFASGTQRYWPGEWTLTANDGTVWSPTMGVGAVTGLRQSFNGTAPQLKFQVSGVDADFIAAARAEVAEYYGRLVRVFWQFFDSAWAPLDTPVVITWGLMRSIEVSRQAQEKGFLRLVTLTGEVPFDGRARAPNAFLTDTAQKDRHPGDRMVERVAGIEAKLIEFPSF
jgi:hypothetical protein